MAHKLSADFAQSVAMTAHEVAEEHKLDVFHKKPLVVSIRRGNMDQVAWFFDVRYAEPTFANERFLLEKARVVFEMRRGLDKVAELAKGKGIRVAEMVPGGSPFQGGAPVFDHEGDLFAIVTVTGQDDVHVDQPLANYLARSIAQKHGFTLSP